MFKRLRKKFTKVLTRVEVRYCEWFYCENVEVKQSDFKQGRYYICFPDGLRIIVETGNGEKKYVGFYTKDPCDR